MAASVASGWTSDTARQVLAAAAVLGRRVDGRLLTAMVGLEEQAVVAALDLPLATVVGHVLDLHGLTSPGVVSYLVDISGSWLAGRGRKSR